MVDGREGETDMEQRNDLLPAVKGIVTQCDRCGSCLTVCPLYGTRDIEASSARGKNNIARGIIEGVLEEDPAVLDAANFCLMCKACVANCPSKVRTDEAMILVRQHFADRHGGANLKYKAIGSIMKNRTLVKLSSGALGIMRKMKLGGLVPFGMAPEGFSREKYLSAFAGPAALGRAASPSATTVTPSSRVAYFDGCGMRMMFPAAAEESLAILNTVGNAKKADNVCCGLPHLVHGLRSDFLALARENITAFADADIVVTDCASCSDTLKHLGDHFTDDPEWRERAAAFSGKVMGLTEYLAKAGYQPRQKADVTVTYHEPCHQGRGQNVKKQPRELLKAAANYVEMSGADVCCGGAGTFHMDYPDIAEALLEKKRANIEKTGARIVVTECPACLVQMNKAAERSGGKFKAMHISQVL